MQVNPLSMNRSCSINVASRQCADSTAAKIDLTKQVEAALGASPGTGLAQDALKVSERIDKSAAQWSNLGCPTKPDLPACAAPAAAIESDFSALSAYVLQISVG